MALNLVKKFRDLAEVEANRATIARDQGCLPLLLSQLSSSESDIVFVALEAINFLSMCPENRQIMKQERSLLSYVQILQTHARSDIQNLSKSIITNLESSTSSVKSTETRRTPKSTTGTPLQECSNNTTPSTGGNNSSKKRARTVTIYVSDLVNETQRKALSEALLKVKGVISFLIDLYAQKVVVRTLTSSSFLVTNLQETTEMNISLKPHTVNKTKKIRQTPEYLADSDDEDENSTSNNCALAKKRTAEDIDDQQQAWGGWGFGRIAKALWG